MNIYIIMCDTLWQLLQSFCLEYTHLKSTSLNHPIKTPILSFYFHTKRIDLNEAYYKQINFPNFIWQQNFHSFTVHLIFLNKFPIIHCNSCFTICCILGFELLLFLLLLDPSLLPVYLQLHLQLQGIHQVSV